MASKLNLYKVSGDNWPQHFNSQIYTNSNHKIISPWETRVIIKAHVPWVTQVNYVTTSICTNSINYKIISPWETWVIIKAPVPWVTQVN